MPREISNSQNFLNNPKVVAELLDLTGVTTEDTVVEIGPGRGIITKDLAKRCKEVIAIEKDPKLANRLRNELTDHTNVRVITADFLNARSPEQPYKVVANIPFNLTSDIIKKLFLEGSNVPETAHLIMQREAAGRFIGKPVATMFSNLLKVSFDVSNLRTVDRRTFSPVPNVDAAFVAFVRREMPYISSQDLKIFQDFLAFGYVYSRRGRPALDSFDRVFSVTQRGIIKRELRLDEMKVTDLDIADWVELFDRFKKLVPADKKAIVRGTMSKLEKEQANLQKQHRTRKR